MTKALAALASAVALAGAGVAVSTHAQAQGSGTENFRKACVLGLQESYRANESNAPSASNLSGATQAQIDNGCRCVTNAFAAAGNARSAIVEFGIQSGDYGMTFKLSRIGWYSVQGRYIDETIDYERSHEGLQEKYRGNPLNTLRNMFAPPPKERFVRQAQTCLQQNIDQKRYLW